jgi:hypothetical protein
MSSEARGSRLAARNLGVVLLVACALWLVVQNTMLALALVWARPGSVQAVSAALVKTAVLLVQGFWTSPASGWLAGTVAGLTLGAVLPYIRREVIRHG